jgi:hypothetical protein
VFDAEREHGDEHQVTPLELFFDLVFVFAITQVTSLLAHNPTWGGVLFAYLLVRLLHLALCVVVGRGEPDRLGVLGSVRADGDLERQLAALGLVVVSALWWLYFDVAAIFARRRLTEASGVERAAPTASRLRSRSRHLPRSPSSAPRARWSLPRRCSAIASSASGSGIPSWRPDGNVELPAAPAC